MKFKREILTKSFAIFSCQIFSHRTNFNEIFGRRMSKSLTISAKNNPFNYYSQQLFVNDFQLWHFIN